jgi:hypothetical protein
VLTILVLVSFSGICLFGVRDSSAVALTILTFHLGTMFAVAVAAVVRWGINGNSTLSSNWIAAQPASIAEIVKQIFFGVSIGFLAYTGIAPTADDPNRRVRVDTELCRRDTTGSLSQSSEEFVVDVIYPIGSYDVTRLGRRTVLGYSIVFKQHRVGARRIRSRCEMVTNHCCRGCSARFVCK